MEPITTLVPPSPSITKREKPRTPTVNHPFITPKKTIELKKSPISTISKLKKEIMDMSPIDTTKWNGMEYYSPASRNFLKKIPLFDLDEKMGMNPFSNSLKMYDPTGAQGTVTTDGIPPKTPDVVTATSATLGPSYPNANGPPQNIPEAKKKKTCTPPPAMLIGRKDDFPKFIGDLNFGAPPELHYDYDY